MTVWILIYCLLCLDEPFYTMESLSLQTLCEVWEIGYHPSFYVNIDSNVKAVSIDSNTKKFSTILWIIESHNITTFIDNPNAKIIISDNKLNDNNLQEIEMKCKDVSIIEKRYFSYILTIIFTLIAIYLGKSTKTFYFSGLRNTISFYNKKMEILYQEPTNDDFLKACPKEKSLEMAIQNDTEIISTIRLKRFPNTCIFSKCVAFTTQSELVLMLTFDEKILTEEENEIHVKAFINSKTKSLKGQAKVRLRSFRYIRPIEVKLELNTGQRCKFQLPVGALTPFQPYANVFSVMTSLLMDSYKSFRDNPYNTRSFTVMLDKYCPILCIKRAFFIDDNGELVYEFASQGIQKVGTCIEFLRGIDKNEDRQQFATDCSIADTTWAFVRRTKSAATSFTIVFCFDGLKSDLIKMHNIPILAYCTSFVYQMAVSRNSSLRFSRITDMLFRSGNFALYETMDGKLMMESHSDDLLRGKASFLALHRPSGFAADRVSVDGREMAVSSLKNGNVVTILTEEISALSRQATQRLAGINMYGSTLIRLNLQRIFTNGKPRLADGGNLLESLGHLPGTSLMNVIVKEDQDTIKTLGLGVTCAASGLDLPYTSFCASYIYKWSGAERRFMRTAESRNLVIDPQSSSSAPLPDAAERAVFRILDARGSPHWFAMAANADIGYIFPVESIVADILPGPAFKAVSTERNFLLWIVIGSKVVSVDGAPTIWDLLCIDPSTPFEQLEAFMQGSSPSSLYNFVKVLDGTLKSWIGDISLTILGGDSAPCRLSLSWINGNLVCGLYQYVDCLSKLSELDARARREWQLRAGGAFLWKFYDNTDLSSDPLRPSEGSPTATLSWACLERDIDPLSRDTFVRRMRSALDFGHPCDVDVRTLDGRWLALRGQQSSPVSVTGICVDITDAFDSSVFRTASGKGGEGDISMMLAATRKILASLDIGSLPADRAGRVEEAIYQAEELLGRITT